jgi:putative flippase GtrA
MPERTSLFHRKVVRRLIRYGSVSAIATVTSLIVLGVLVGLESFPAIWSNVIATAIGTIPSFELNRRWVWGQGGQRSVSRQAVPYILLSFAGLVISTVAVHLASDATIGSTRLVHTIAVELANISAYGALWIVQFVLCDRVLFRSAPDLVDDRRTQGPAGERKLQPVSTPDPAAALVGAGRRRN